MEYESPDGEPWGLQPPLNLVIYIRPYSQEAHDDLNRQIAERQAERDALAVQGPRRAVHLYADSRDYDDVSYAEAN